MFLLTTKTAFLENAMFRLLKAVPLTLALAALSFFFTGCGSNSAQARFVNAVPDVGTLDIDVNGTKEFPTVPFATASASTYVGVPSGSDTIEAFPTGGTTQAFPNQTLSLASGSLYTLVATGFVNGTVNILNPVDNNTSPADASVSFRIINASPSGPNGTDVPVDIYILPNLVTCTLGSTGCTPAVSGLAYQSTSAYANQSFNSSGLGYTMFVTTAGSTTPVFNVGLTAGSSSVGTICTLVLTDISGGGRMNDVPVVLSDLNSCSLAQ
jgi:hypothetical protein